MRWYRALRPTFKMDPYGTLWYLVVPCGTLWYLIVPYGNCLLVCMCAQFLLLKLNPSFVVSPFCVSVPMVLTSQKRAELRAEKAIRENNTAFKPRGAANRAAFNVMKREFEKQTEQINSHTSSETTRVISELGDKTERQNKETQAKIDKANKENMERFEKFEKHVGINMKKIPGSQEQWILTLNSSSVSVANLNTLLTTHGLPKKGTKGQKALILSRLHPTVLQNFMDEQISQSRPSKEIAVDEGQGAGTGDSERPPKRAKHSSSSSSSSYSSASSSDSEKEEK